MLRSALFFAAMVLSSPAMAGQFNVADHVITTITTGWGAEGIYVATQGTLPAGADCGAGNTFMMEVGHPLQKEILALLMSTLQSDGKVNIFVDGCVGNAMKLKSVTVGH